MDWLILALSLIAGVVGTGLGGVIGALLKNRGRRVMGRVLSFAGGVMAGVVAFEMIPEAIDASLGVGRIGGILLAVATTVGGMIIIFLINKLLDLIEKKKHAHGDVATLNGVIASAQNANVCRDDNAAIKAESLSKSKKVRVFSGMQDAAGQRRSMLKAGTVMLIAIALHNFPEGMAIGASGSLGTDMGALIALIIAVHNVPEGMAIAAPLVSGGVGSLKAVMLTALAGAATVLGAVVGLAVGGLGALATGICLALASGAMLYVTFCEIVPQSIAMNDGEVPAVSMLAGLILSIIFVFVF